VPFFRRWQNFATTYSKVHLAGLQLHGPNGVFVLVQSSR